MKRKKFDSINVVPFIDIILVLLVIVLTTASFVAKGMIPLDLSKSTSATKIKKNQTLNISIKKDGLIYFDEKQIEINQISKFLQKYKKNSAISIASDKKASIDSFIQILDILKTKQYTNISIITKVNK